MFFLLVFEQCLRKLDVYGYDYNYENVYDVLNESESESENGCGYGCGYMICGSDYDFLFFFFIRNEQFNYNMGNII